MVSAPSAALLILFGGAPVNSWTCPRVPGRSFSSVALRYSTTEIGPSAVQDGDEQDDFWDVVDDLEVLQGDGRDFDYDEEDEDEDRDWIPDAIRAEERRYDQRNHLVPANEVLSPYDRYEDTPSSKVMDEDREMRRMNDQPPVSPYTDEEEELIAAMGGRRFAPDQPSRREDGFLGDSTLAEIATDYSVPISYLADVICTWGVPAPIDIHDRLGDLVTGEQAFALVEAVNSLDIGVLQDRYSNQNLLQVCDDWDIDLKDAFEFALKEGWNLPFGVRTNLRVEQEDELLRVFSTMYRGY